MFQNANYIKHDGERVLINSIDTHTRYAGRGRTDLKPF